MSNSLSIKLKECYPTEIYVSDAGYLCIKQSRDYGRDDSLILLTPEQAEHLADFIHTNRTEMLEAWMGGVEQEGE